MGGRFTSSNWIDQLDEATHARVVQAIDLLAEMGPGLGGPLVDTIHASSIANLKELRPGTVRILFAFDPWRSSILAGRRRQGRTVECLVPAGHPVGRAALRGLPEERAAEEGGSPL
jgi:hypothetical protein